MLTHGRWGPFGRIPSIFDQPGCNCGYSVRFLWAKLSMASGCLRFHSAAFLWQGLIQLIMSRFHKPRVAHNMTFMNIAKLCNTWHVDLSRKSIRKRQTHWLNFLFCSHLILWNKNIVHSEHIIMKINPLCPTLYRICPHITRNVKQSILSCNLYIYIFMYDMVMIKR